MRYLRKWQLAVVCLLALALLPLTPAPRGTAQATGYTVTDLGTLGNGAGLQSRAYALDECGRVVGESQAEAGDTAPFRPFHWEGGVLTDLGTLGGRSGTAFALNEGGTVVGSALTASSLPHPFVRPPGGPSQDIGTLGGFSAVAQDVNASGVVVGQSENGSLQDRAFIWQPGVGMQALTAPFGTPIRAFGINDAGQVAGSASLPTSGLRAFVTIDGVARNLGTLGGFVSVANAVGEAGEVVGYSYIAIPPTEITQSFHAFLWKDTNGNHESDPGEMIDLGLLSGDGNSYAYDINSAGVVVGYSETGLPEDANVKRAFIWTSANGLQDLNVVAAGLGWTFQEARAINDRGQIVGTGVNPDGKTHAFLLTPTNAGPSPCDPTPTPTPTPSPTPTPVPPALQFSAATYAVGEGGGSVVISVSRTGDLSGTSTVNYATSDGTATAGPSGDYVAASGTLTFNPLETTKTFSVTVNQDTLDEPDETVNLTLSSPGGGATLGAQSTATLNITDDDVPMLEFDADVPANEGDSGTTNASFNVKLSGASWQTVTVNFAIADGSATRPADYTAPSYTGTLTFNPGETSKSIGFSVVGDTADEVNENFNVTLSGATNATILDSQAICTILDDDGPPSLSVGDVTVTEGNSGTTTATFNVSLLPASGQAVSVSYATADGTATTANGDYASKSGTLNFAIGETSKEVTVNVNGDTTFEGDESFKVNLSGATNAILSDAQGVGTITDDDGGSVFQFSSAAYSVGESAGTVTVTVTRTGSTAGGVSVGYATTTGGTATAGSDYTAASGTLNFGAGDTSKTFTVAVADDTLDEADETVNLALSSPLGGTLGTQSAAILTITDNDAQPTLQFDSATYSVGEGGVSATVTVTRTGGSNGGLTVNYATSNGTATAGSDYAAHSGTLTFAAGDNSESFTVSVTNDALDEVDETVNLTLSSPGGGAALGPQSAAVLTINDDDAMPSLSVNDVTVTEGNSGTTNAAFTVSLSAASGKTVTVLYITGAITATDSVDYNELSSSLTFNPGETSKTVNVEVIGDTRDEPDETFSFNLGSPTNATIGDAQGIGTIKNDDAAPALSVNDVTITEGDAGTTNADFAVKLSAPSGLTVSVNVATSNGTATAGSDYTAVPATTLTFNPGETSKSFSVPVLGDTLDEANETFNVTLSSPSNATVSDSTGVGTINDDDGAPSLSINDVTVTEGNAGTTNATFNVTLSAGSGQAVSVNFATADGTAAQPSDYGAASGTLNFAAGETTKTITVNVKGDTANESNETFFVNLSGALNATVSDNQGQGTITNDDTPTLRFSQAIYPVGESAHFVTITVTRTGDMAPAVSVNFATSDGTATERRDYTAASGRLQFAADETSKTFDVLLTEDAYTEPEETVNLTLSNPTGGASLGSQSTATVNIAADDNPPPGVNPIDLSSDFVRQHYHDFLNREPDASGLKFWTDVIEECGDDAACREVKRINVSAAFFLSIEFQQTGYLVYRTYKAAYGDATSPNVPGTVPVVRLHEFLPDTRSIGEGVVVGQPNWEQTLNANKNAYMLDFVQRPRFLAEYPLSMPLDQFMAKLSQNTGVSLTGPEQEEAAALIRVGPEIVARAGILRLFAESQALQQNEFRRAYVLMEYFGYLRRNPDDPQDTDFRGWKFWLDKLNDFNGDAVKAEMVKAFLDSIEYRTRFAP